MSNSIQKLYNTMPQAQLFHDPDNNHLISIEIQLKDGSIQFRSCIKCCHHYVGVEGWLTAVPQMQVARYQSS